MHGFFPKGCVSIAIGLMLCSGSQTVLGRDHSVSQGQAETHPAQAVMAMIGEGDRRCLVAASDSAGDERVHLLSLYERVYGDLLWEDRERYEALINALDDLVGDGLDPVLYGAVQLREWREVPRDRPNARACRDLLATSAYLTALHHLRNGFLPRQVLEPLWRENDDAATDLPDTPAQEFNRIALQGLDDVAGAFQWARPAFAGYSDLREAFLRWRDRYRFGDWVEIPGGPVIRPGDEDERVPLLRQRLDLPLSSDDGEAAIPVMEERRYSGHVVAAVKAFQRTHGIKVDGVLGPETLAALNVSRGFRQDQLRVNLERLRWLGSELRDDQLLVDIAGARTLLIRNRQVVWQGRAQVGTAARPTPALSSRITHLTFNPSWTVPPTIYRKDKLPQIRRDPGYLASNRLRVLDRDGHELDPATVDWNNPGAIVLRQDPGPANALGQVALRFPNPFMVYLHDTPNQRLFESHLRTFSSGCVRVEGAPALADLLFEGASPGVLKTIAEVRESGETRQIHLPSPLPILMDYWTAAVEDGEVSFRPDIYRRDRALVEALRNKEERWRQALVTYRH